MAKPVQLPIGRGCARIWDAEKKRHISLGVYADEREAEKAQLRAELGILPDEPKTAPTPIRGAVRFEKLAEDLLWSRRHMMSRGTFENYASKLWVDAI